jgi:hypothetical protein
MPVLSFYEGYGEMSFGVFNNELDSNDHILFSFPYTYSYNLFSNSFTKEKFYEDVFFLASEELGIRIEDYDLYTVGVLQNPEVPFEVKKSISLLDTLVPNTMFVSFFLYGMKDNYFSYFPRNLKQDFNFRANLDLYHNIVYSESRDIVLKDSLLRQILSTSDLQVDSEEILFTGDRIREFHFNPALTYLLMFDLLKDPGSYYIRLDTNNLYAHTQLFEFNNVDHRAIGTLINIPSKIECLIETELGAPQLITLDADTLFVVPLDHGESARILIKSSGQNFEKQVFGGELGIILDTREKTVSTEFKEIYLSALSQFLSRL